MDLVSLIELIGEPQTLALLGLVLAFSFGFIAQRSGFCTRSAILEIMSGKLKTAFPLWFLALAAAIFLVQSALYFNLIDVSETRFFATPLSLSGALIGGALFGIGMALARGCASRLLVLGASGNLRAITTIAIMGVVAWLTLEGPLSPLRNTFSSYLNTSVIGTNDLVASSQLGPIFGVLIGAFALIGAVFIAVRGKLSTAKSVGGLSIGGLIAGGWYFTYSLSTQVFDPIQAESISFIRPSANILNYIASFGDEAYLSLDTGLFAGIIAGAFVSSVLFKSFKVRKFSDAGAPGFPRYIAGGALMGFGGILSVGCTIGAGFTGGSVLAISSIVGLISMMVFCGLTEILLKQLELSTTQKFTLAHSK